MSTKEDTGGDKTVIPEDKTSEQIENLNKGIAKYRDEAAVATAKATAAEKVAAEAKAEVDALKAKGDKKDDKSEDVQLSPADQKRLDAWAKSQGFVTKEESEAEKGRLFNESLKSIESQAIDEFVKAHPDYEDGEKWEKVKKEFGQYKQPTSITAYRQILNKIHKELSGEDEKLAEIRAKEEKRKLLGLGGSNAKEGGDSNVTLEELQKKYPHLSAEVIESRLLEINQLSEARAKKAAAKKK